MAYSAINAGDQDQDSTIQEGGAFEEALEEKNPELRTAKKPKQLTSKRMSVSRRTTVDAAPSGSEDLLSSIKALAQSSSTISQQQALGTLAST